MQQKLSISKPFKTLGLCAILSLFLINQEILAADTATGSPAPTTAPTSAPAIEQNPAQKPAQKQVEVRPQMAQFRILMQELSPYLLSEKEFNNPDNQKKIERILADLNANVAQLNHKKDVQGSNMKFRFKALAEGFKDVEYTFKNRFLDYSYWALKSQLHQCSACHTEKQLEDRWYNADLIGKADLYAQAEFQFMLRGYEEAVKKYMQIIKEYPSNKITEEQLNRAVKKTGYYYVRILKDDGKTLEAFKEISTNKNLPNYLTRHLKKWIEYLEVKKFRLLPEASEGLSLDKLKKFVDEREKIAAHFGGGDDRFPVDQETLIYLHQVLDKKPKKDAIPWLYLWIGQFQNSYKESLFDNSGELYLKECFESYPKSAAAAKCKAEYKTITSERDERKK